MGYVTSRVFKRTLFLALVCAAVNRDVLAQAEAAVAGQPGSSQPAPTDKAACPAAPAAAAPPVPKVWSANVAIGYAESGGNAETKNLTPAINIQRVKGGAKWLFGLKGAYGKVKDTTSQNMGMAALIYRADFAEVDKFGDGTFYWGAGALGFYDKIATIDHRYQAVTGIGWHALKGPHVFSDFEVGPGYRWEKKYYGDDLEYPVYRIANYTGVLISKNASFNVDFDFSGSVNEEKNWVFSIDPGLQIMATETIGIKVGGWWRKENDRPSVIKKEDWVFGTQFGLTF